MSTVFFDMSGFRRYLAAHGLPSGIQRVNLMLVLHTAARLGRERVALAFLDCGSGAYRTLPLSEAPDDLTDLPALARALGLTDARGRRRPTLEKYLDRPGARRFHTAMRGLNAALGNERHFARRGGSLAAWRASGRAPSAGPPRRRFDDLFAHARPGDTLVVLDNAWGDRRIPGMHRRAHEAGLRVVPLVHDLCPVLLPQFFTRYNAQRFDDWLRGTTAYATHYLANSQATAADLRAFLDAQEVDTPIEVMPLAQSRLILPGARPGASAAGAAPPAVAARRDLSDGVASLAARPFVLCVGTLEIRKNLWGLAQVWDRLRRDPALDPPRLVLAGRPGWLNEDFERLVAATGHLGGWLRVLHGPSDAELDHLYRACQFTICVSFKEGWGLPIGESLGYGKTGVVSGLSSMPEVGGAFVEYCDPHSLSSIEAACRRLIEDGARRAELERRIAQARLRSWEDVAGDLVAAIGA